MPLPRVLKQMLTPPTAAGREDAVLDVIRTLCEPLSGVSLAADRHGNLLARYRHRPRRVTPLVFGAHTDHPAFVALEMADARHVLAEFRGGVRPEYFAGARVRFWTDGGPVRGRVRELLPAAAPSPGQVVAMPRRALVAVPRAIAPDTIGMWDLPDPELRDGLVVARGCDDVAGAAALVALLQRLSRQQAQADVLCLFTRAEEVGFVGAIAAARDATVPRHLPIIAIETSKALPTAPQGAGPILRVGDRAGVFTPALTLFCQRVAQELQQRRKGFAFQRKLMDGGTCESTAYMAYGYEATGICVALGNYHNMDERRGRIGSESISLSDWQGMVDWFAALVLDPRGYRGDEAAGLRPMLEKRYAAYAHLLDGRARGRAARRAASSTTRRAPSRT